MLLDAHNMCVGHERGQLRPKKWGKWIFIFLVKNRRPSKKMKIFENFHPQKSIFLAWKIKNGVPYAFTTCSGLLSEVNRYFSIPRTSCFDHWKWFYDPYEKWENAHLRDILKTATVIGICANMYILASGEQRKKSSWSYFWPTNESICNIC